MGAGARAGQATATGAVLVVAAELVVKAAAAATAVVELSA